MNLRLSVREFIAAMPVPTLVYDRVGVIAAATKSFWRVVGSTQPVPCLANLDDACLVDTLLRIASSEGKDQGVEFWQSGPQGMMRILWRRIEDSGQEWTIACPISEPSSPAAMELAVAESPLLHSEPPPASRDLPNSTTTTNLLRQALATCREQRIPLSIARLSVHTRHGRPVFDIDNETWRSIGRKLRTTCRMSDLVGIADSGDFLVILVNCDLTQAKGVTHRVLGQLSDWACNQLLAPVVLGAGYATWTPDKKHLSAEQLLEQASHSAQVGTND